MDEEEVDVVGPQGLQPLIDHLQEVGWLAGHVLGDQDDLLADRRVLFEPLLEVDLGPVDLGGVEEANAAREGEAEDAFRARPPGGPLLEERDLDPGLAQLPLGQYREPTLGLRGGVLRFRAGSQAHASGRRHRAGLEERAAIGAVRLVVGHRSELLWKCSESRSELHLSALLNRDSMNATAAEIHSTRPVELDSTAFANKLATRVTGPRKSHLKEGGGPISANRNLVLTMISIM